MTIYSKSNQADDSGTQLQEDLEKLNTIELKHEETNTWYLVQEDNIQSILYQQNTYKPNA